ncbi:YunG family protein [Streptomyces sp. NPDC055189]
MSPLILTDIEEAVRASWGPDTYPSDSSHVWPPDNPARGQCGVTALVLQDLLGGELIRGEVRVAGEWTDHHWWNRLGEGLEVDLTREQFMPEEIVSGGVVIVRPPQIRRLCDEYELLRARVLEKLGVPG